MEFAFTIMAPFLVTRMNEIPEKDKNNSYL